LENSSKNVIQSKTDNILYAVLDQNDLGQWIASSNLKTLLQNKFTIDLLVRRNPEYFIFKLALEERLHEVDTNGLYHFSESSTYAFFEKCFSANAAHILISPLDVPIYDVLGLNQGDDAYVPQIPVSSGDKVLLNSLRENVKSVSFKNNIQLILKKESKLKQSTIDCRVMHFLRLFEFCVPS
jgi:hypothetical protein